MEYRLECGVQLCPGSNPDLPTTSFRGPWEIDFERIFTLRNLEIRGFTGNYEPTGRGTARGCQNLRIDSTFPISFWEFAARNSGPQPGANRACDLASGDFSIGRKRQFGMSNPY